MSHGFTSKTICDLDNRDRVRASAAHARAGVSSREVVRGAIAKARARHPKHVSQSVQDGEGTHKPRLACTSICRFFMARATTFNIDGVSVSSCALHVARAPGGAFPYKFPKECCRTQVPSTEARRQALGVARHPLSSRAAQACGFPLPLGVHDSRWRGLTIYGSCCHFVVTCRPFSSRPSQPWRRPSCRLVTPPSRVVPPPHHRQTSRPHPPVTRARTSERNRKHHGA